MPPKSRDVTPQHSAEALAIRALGFLGRNPERLARFLSATGLEPETLRAAAVETGFLAGVLDHIAADENLLLAFAADESIDPATLARAREVLAVEMGAWPVGHNA
jgi:hypothetical protein